MLGFIGLVLALIIVPTASTAQSALPGLVRDAVETPSKGKALIAFKEANGKGNWPSLAEFFAREAARRRTMGSTREAIELSEISSRLAAGSVTYQIRHALLVLKISPELIVDTLPQLIRSVPSIAAQPRVYRRLIRGVSLSMLGGVCFCTVVTLSIFFAKSIRFALHDIFHVFPRGTLGVLTATLISIGLLLPVTLHAGIGILLILVYGVVFAHLDWRERVVGLTLLLLTGSVPWLAESMARATAFDGTFADPIDRVQQGEPNQDAALSVLEARTVGGQGTFPEMFALGNQRLRQNRSDEALVLLSDAAQRHRPSAELLISTGNVMAAKGNQEGALQAYQIAATVDPTSALARFNLSLIKSDQAKSLGDEQAALAREEAASSRSAAHAIDPTLDLDVQTPIAPALPLNELLSLAVLPEEVAADLKAGVSAAWLGNPQFERAVWRYGGCLILSLLVGLLAASRRPSRQCQDCGKAVCARCAPPSPPGGRRCVGCESPSKSTISKQLEIIDWKERRKLLADLRGVILCGSKHFSAQSPFRGALYLFSLGTLTSGLMINPGTGMIWLIGMTMVGLYRMGSSQ